MGMLLLLTPGCLNTHNYSISYYEPHFYKDGNIVAIKRVEVTKPAGGFWGSPTSYVTVADKTWLVELAMDYTSPTPTVTGEKIMKEDFGLQWFRFSKNCELIATEKSVFSYPDFNEKQRPIDLRDYTFLFWTDDSSKGVYRNYGVSDLVYDWRQERVDWVGNLAGGPHVRLSDGRFVIVRGDERPGAKWNDLIIEITADATHPTIDIPSNLTPFMNYGPNRLLAWTDDPETEGRDTGRNPVVYDYELGKVVEGPWVKAAGRGLEFYKDWLLVNESDASDQVSDFYFKVKTGNSLNAVGILTGYWSLPEQVRRLSQEGFYEKM
jgi:hypothetical protein